MFRTRNDVIKKLYFKTMTYVVISIVICVLFSQVVFAHPAEDLHFKYNFDEQELLVTIRHITKDPNAHYISKLDVYKNDFTIIEEDYSSQLSADVFELTFDVDAEENDILRIEVECNENGKVEESLTVTDGSQTPGFECVAVLFSILLVFVLINRKRIMGQ